VKKPVLSLEDDIRWRRLKRSSVVCGTCQQAHQGVFDLAVNGPEHWHGDRDRDREPNSAVLDKSHVLTEDFCVIDGRDYFVRCVLRLPIIGANEEFFAYGVWCSLSPVNFRRYCEAFDSGTEEPLGPWFGWFSNRLEGYPETLNLKCQVHPQLNRQRPLIELEPTEHPLALEQRSGITLDRLFEIYALNGHDLRGGLSGPSPD
jgi:hypothetical protein